MALGGAAGPSPSPWPSGWAGSGPGPEAGWSALVFAGCGERQVSLAKSFWNSVTLQPPLESRLVPRKASGGSGTALGLAGNSNSNSASKDAAGPGLAARRSHFDAQKSGVSLQASAISRKEETGIQGDPETEKVDEQKAQYLQKAKRREEILALLKKQREERIMKEAVSRPYRPKSKVEERVLKIPESDVEDQESVRALP